MKKLMVNHYHWSITMEMARLSERIAYALHLSCVTAHQTGFSNLFKNYFNQNWIKRNWSNNGREINFYYKNNIFGSPASDCVAVLRARARRYFRLFWAGTVHAWGNLPQKQEGGGGDRDRSDFRGSLGSYGKGCDKIRVQSGFVIINYFRFLF